MSSQQPPSRPDGFALSGDSRVQTEILENLAGAPRYQAWLASLAEPLLGDDPIELGSGTGDYAALWLERGLTHITLTEVDPHRRSLLLKRFAGEPRVTVGRLNLASPARAQHSAMVSFNVLEHIRDDDAALRCATRVVRPGGYVFHLVPAFPIAMSDFDRKIGHFRRYRRKELAAAAIRAGLIVDDVRYINVPGLIAWFIMMRLLRGQPKDGPALRFWDRCVVPVARWAETRARAPFGQSVVLIARVPVHRLT
jgi:SAM-dependent methyltransferase